MADENKDPMAESDTEQSETEQSETEQSETEQSETEQSETEQSEPKQPKTKPIYLDYNATTPMEEAVIEAITKGCREQWANPRCWYPRATEAYVAIERARDMVNFMVKDIDDDGFPEQEITFTSGGHEATLLALECAFHPRFDLADGEKPHIITTNIEHVATIGPLRQYERDERIELTLIPVDKFSGRINANDVARSLRKNTVLVTMIWANNETGIIQPLDEVRRHINYHNRTRPNCAEVWLHVDAAQTIGKIPVDVDEIGADMMTIVGHKFYGPRIGALWHREDAPLRPIFKGGPQEHCRRAGTVNTPMVMGLGVAAELVVQHVEQDMEDMERILNHFIKQLKIHCGDLFTDNFTDQRAMGMCLPNTLSASFRGYKSGKELLEKCNWEIEASTSAACHSANKPSPILLKCGVPEERAVRTVRFSIGRHTTVAEVELAAQKIGEALAPFKPKDPKKISD